MLCYSQKLLYNCVFATLRELTDSADMLVFVLPTLIALINHSTDEDYRNLLQPELHKIISMARPVQVSCHVTCVIHHFVIIILTGCDRHVIEMCNL